jgi:DNA helicase-2/ATP-dependent DNA helicase PcrA
MTRAKDHLHLHVPVRYYHRPRGGDDAHGFGKRSRFLTSEVRGLCRVTECSGVGVDADGELVEARPDRRITVSVDALFA